jgi:hypothetical protein
MLQDPLTSLAVLHMHRYINIDIDRVMCSFTLGKSRHIDFGYENRNTLLHAPFDSQSVHIAILSTCFKCYFVYL